jgi:hypothetical protein
MSCYGAVERVATPPVPVSPTAKASRTGRFRINLILESF